MIAILLLGTLGGEFTTVDFDGLSIPVPIEAGEPIVLKNDKKWEVMLDPRLTAKSRGAPLYSVRITDHAMEKSFDEGKVLQQRAKKAPQAVVGQRICRTTLAKIGPHDLVILNGSGMSVRNRYFVTALFSRNKKVYEYQLVSPDGALVEKAMKSLQSMVVKDGEEVLKTEGTPANVQGEYTVALPFENFEPHPISVITPIVPVQKLRHPFLPGIGWYGTIGDPRNGGCFLEFHSIDRYWNAHYDTDVVELILMNMLDRLDGFSVLLGPRSRGHAYDGNPLSPARLKGTRAGLPIDALMKGDVLMVGEYQRVDHYCAAVAFREISRGRSPLSLNCRAVHDKAGFTLLTLPGDGNLFVTHI